MKRLLLSFLLISFGLASQAQGTAPQVEITKVTKTSFQVVFQAKDTTTKEFEAVVTGPGYPTKTTRVKNNVTVPTFTVSGLKPGTTYKVTSRSVYITPPPGITPGVAFTGNTLTLTPASLIGTTLTRTSLAGASITSKSANSTSASTESFGPTKVSYVTTLEDFPPKPTLNLVNNCPQFVGLNWSYPASGGAVKNIKIQKSYGGAWYPVADVPPYENTYYDLDLSPGKHVTYRAATMNSLDEMTWSNNVSFQIRPYVAPDAPINLRTGKVTNNSIELIWDNPEEDQVCKSNIRQVYYILMKRQFQSEYQVYSYTYPGSNNFTITGLEENEPVQIAIFAISDQDIQGERAYLSAQTAGPSSKPSNLIGVGFKDALGDWALGISWTHNNAEKDTDYYKLEYSTDSVTFKPLTFTKVGEKVVNHVNISEGQKYTYRVKAGNYIYGESDWLYMNGWVTLDYSSVPSAPYGLKATKSGAGVVLSWIDESNKEETYIVERSNMETGPFTEVGTVSRNITTYTDESVASGDLFYRVKAGNPLGTSATSNVAKIVIASSSSGTSGFITYPNPTVDKITVIPSTDLKATELIQVEVYNQGNQLMFSKKYSPNTLMQINMSKYLPGLYNVVITSDNIKETKKIIKN